MTFNRWSTTASSNSSSDSTINWAEGQAPSSVNDSARGMMAAMRKFGNDISGATITSTGSANTYSVSTAQVFNSLTDGLQLAFKANVTNTGASTINVDGLGARPLRSTSGVNLAAGEITSGAVYTICYEATANEWLIHGGPVVVSSGGGGSTPTFSAFGTTWVNLANASAARTNLGLGTSAVFNVQTSGTNIPLLDGNNTHSGANTFTGVNTFSGPVTFSHSSGIAARNTAKAFGRCPNGGSGVSGFNCTATNSGTGTYVFSLSPSMPNTSYTVAISIENGGAPSAPRVALISAKSVNSITIRTNNDSGTASSVDAVSIVIYDNA